MSLRDEKLPCVKLCIPLFHPHISRSWAKHSAANLPGRTGHNEVVCVAQERLISQ